MKSGRKMHDGPKSANRIGRRAAMVAGAFAICVALSPATQADLAQKSPQEQREIISRALAPVEGYSDPAWRWRNWKPQFTLAYGHEDKLCRPIIDTINTAAKEGRPLFDDPMFVKWRLEDTLTEPVGREPAPAIGQSHWYVGWSERAEAVLFNDGEPLTLIRGTSVSIRSWTRQHFPPSTSDLGWFATIVADADTTSVLTETESRLGGAFPVGYATGRRWPDGQAYQGDAEDRLAANIHPYLKWENDSPRYPRRGGHPLGQFHTPPDRAALYDDWLGRSRIEIGSINGFYFYLLHKKNGAMAVASVARSNGKIEARLHCAFDAGRPPPLDIRRVKLHLGRAAIDRHLKPIPGFADPSWWYDYEIYHNWRPNFTLALNRDDQLCGKVVGAINQAVEQATPLFADPIFVKWQTDDTPDDNDAYRRSHVRSEHVAVPLFNNGRLLLLIRRSALGYGKVVPYFDVSVSVFDYNYGHDRTWADWWAVYSDSHLLAAASHLIHAADNRATDNEKSPLKELLLLLPPEKRSLYHPQTLVDTKSLELVHSNETHYVLRRTLFEGFVLFSIAEWDGAYRSDLKCAFDAGKPPWKKWD